MRGNKKPPGDCAMKNCKTTALSPEILSGINAFRYQGIQAAQTYTQFEDRPAYDEVDDLDFSMDGKSFAYRSKLSGKWAIVVGGEDLTPSAGAKRNRSASTCPA